MRCNQVPPEILRENRIVFRFETCARDLHHKGQHRSEGRQWNMEDKESLARNAAGEWEKEQKP